MRHEVFVGRMFVHGFPVTLYQPTIRMTSTPPQTPHSYVKLHLFRGQCFTGELSSPNHLSRNMSPIPGRKPPHHLAWKPLFYVSAVLRAACSCAECLAAEHHSSRISRPQQSHGGSSQQSAVSSWQRQYITMDARHPVQFWAVSSTQLQFGVKLPACTKGSA